MIIGPRIANIKEIIILIKKPKKSEELSCPNTNSYGVDI